MLGEESGRSYGIFEEREKASGQNGKINLVVKRCQKYSQ